jgi:hypothetical protein
MTRDAISFIAYHVYMALPDWIARRCVWMLPSVGWWAHREGRLAVEGETKP